VGTAYNARCHSTVHDQFRHFLVVWLRTLTQVSWCGTAADLTTTLKLFNEQENLRAIVPSGSGLSKFLIFHEQHIAAASWSLEFRRTKSARLIELTKARGKRATTRS
jgi:hypothetical protein